MDMDAGTKSLSIDLYKPADQRSHIPSFSTTDTN